jgi:hypothetical protein
MIAFALLKQSGRQRDVQVCRFSESDPVNKDSCFAMLPLTVGSINDCYVCVSLICNDEKNYL